MNVASVRLASGLGLPYVEHGDPAGVPVVFLHGITDSWRSFERVLPLLPPRFRAIALTQRGHGDADRPDAGYRARDFAADLAGVLDALGVDRAVVVGHSMGSANAIRFALDHPDRTRGLVLVAAFATFRDKPDLVAFVDTAIRPLVDPIDPAFAREFQESTLARPLAPELFAMVVAESLKVPARVWRAAFTDIFADDFGSELARIEAPTLILWGDRDGYCGRDDQDRLVAGIRGARLVAYEGVGHALHWEVPERFAADVTTFVDGLST